MKNKYNFSFSIVIPTYNRPNLLKSTILSFINEAIKYDIHIYISDDSTNDETERKIEQIKDFYPNLKIFYHKNNTNIGHDKNCIKALSLSTQDYIWYLGDASSIINGGIEKVLEICQNNEADFISCSSKSRKNIPISSKTYKDDLQLLKELGWHLTMTGVTIYKRESLLLNSFNVNLSPNFPQMALIFHSFFFKKNIKLYWLNERLIYGSGKKQSYWKNDFIKVFIDDFKKTLLNLPQKYDKKTIDFVIKNHSINTGVLRYYRFISSRIDKNWDIYMYISRIYDIYKYSDINIFILGLITIIPPKWIKKMYDTRNSKRL